MVKLDRESFQLLMKFMPNVSISFVWRFISTLWRLGFFSLLKIALYRTLKRINYFSLSSFRDSHKISGDFFSIDRNSYLNTSFASYLETDNKGVDFLNGYYWYFDSHKRKVGYPPNWFYNPWNSNYYSRINEHWSTLTDLDYSNGDIKIYWELSRFKWVISLAYNYRINKDVKIINEINRLINDWCSTNTVNLGPNWMCGQETSLRVILLIVANDFYLNSYKQANSSLLSFVEISMKRIYLTFFYAAAQNNNHITTEATALYIGGLFLKYHNRDGSKYLKKGRRLLEKYTNKLISKNGSFSQHSVVYHRMLLDTLCLAELIRLKYSDRRFSNRFYSNFDNALNWLSLFCPGEKGEAWNLGSNDGSSILHFPYSNYWDFRPTIQLSNILLHGTSLCHLPNYKNEFEVYNLSSSTIFSTSPDLLKKDCVNIIDDSYFRYSFKDLTVFLRLPYFNFRPAQNDIHHLDIWYKGLNIFPDSGTFSYFEGLGEKLKSVEYHNTVQFDNYEPMEPISRFLLLDWFKSKIREVTYKDFGKSSICFSTNYSDRYKNSHNREIQIEEDNSVVIIDKLTGKFNQAFIRFNFICEHILKNNGNSIETEHFEIIFEASDCKLTREMQSDNYLKAYSVNRITLLITKPGVISTKIIFK